MTKANKVSKILMAKCQSRFNHHITTSPIGGNKNKSNNTIRCCL